jgi:glycosyltransferase involved in cell wall biosynthesis
MKTLVVIPAYNAEKTVGGVIAGCLKHCPDVLGVDDGSTDGTKLEIEKAGALCLSNGVNRGKGYSLRRGFEHAAAHGFDVVITLDADGQHDPGCIPQFIEDMEKGFDVVIGTRKKRHSAMPYPRRASNFLLSALFSLLIGRRVRDTQSGYRALRVSALKGLELRSERYETESEILMKLGRRKAKFGEIPIPVIYGGEKSHINPLVDFFRFVRVLKYRGRG